jgi:hypothetical protein
VSSAYLSMVAVMPGGRGRDYEWHHLFLYLLGLGFHDTVPHVWRQLPYKYYFSWQCQVHVSNLKVLFVWDDELQTQRTLGKLPG